MALDQAQTLKLMGAVRDMSLSLTRIAAERELQKNIRNDICNELDLNPKVFNKIVKTYHKQNFVEEQNTHEEFETLYEQMDSKTSK